MLIRRSDGNVEKIYENGDIKMFNRNDPIGAIIRDEDSGIIISGMSDQKMDEDIEKMNKKVSILNKEHSKKFYILVYSWAIIIMIFGIYLIVAHYL